MLFRKGDSVKVKILQGNGYIDRYGKKYQQNSIADMPDWLASKLSRYGIVEIIREKPVERAVKSPAETTAKRK